MIQTGDPTNTGNGGESIYSEDFRDELHSRLKFSHRGIVAMANKNKPNSNGSQFFITLDKCPEMDKKYTIFGKVTGPTFFNAVTISNLSANEDGVPSMKDEEKPKITNTEVVINPFKDLKPTDDLKNEVNNVNSRKKSKKRKSRKN
jgi:peptidyl-prolyl cis-trans isomerase SDCCAG10